MSSSTKRTVEEAKQGTRTALHGPTFDKVNRLALHLDEEFDLDDVKQSLGLSDSQLAWMYYQAQLGASMEWARILAKRFFLVFVVCALVFVGSILAVAYFIGGWNAVLAGTLISSVFMLIFTNATSNSWQRTASGIRIQAVERSPEGAQDGDQEGDHED